ncbi:dedicator of cytokinesis protein 2 [Stylonychia lemnae]|uniref:Dedicator of cytokinesis protein 2 n=1 Tax=Stylonychia lemnae TaxID=5949 RepID=A0A078B7U0_STYLE|nr:dedicator of cytokinesis protein 2 [Stylonychia lemnae]|eukprot:CDW89623.1 dedicator of cytokinesis protein 2 [Stylonychia lemnae]
MQDIIDNQDYPTVQERNSQLGATLNNLMDDDEIQKNLAMVNSQFDFNDFISEQDLAVGEDQDQSILDDLVLRCAKKNLCFELEYIQTVFQSLNVRASTKFNEFSQQLYEERKISDMKDTDLFTKVTDDKGKNSNKMEKSRGAQINFVDQQKSRDKEIKEFLEKIYNVLISMKNEYLKHDSGKERKQVRKALKAMSCHLERTRQYLDNYIYPRDLSLNLIDVQIESSLQERKKAMHLTERLYSIVYKDFFTVYDKCVELSKKIKQMEGQDVEKINQQHQNESRMSIALHNEIEGQSDDQSQIETQTIVSENKTTRDVDEVRKNFLRNTLGVKKEGMLKLVKNFCPSLCATTNFDLDEMLDKEFSLIFSIKCINISNHEIFLTMYQENGQPYSLTAFMDASRILNGQQAEYVFLNISMRSLLSNNLAIIVNVVEKRRSKSQSLTHNLLSTNDEFNTHKVYKGYTILPLSRLFWAQQLKFRQIFEIKEAMFYKQSNTFKIEDRYATLIDKRAFKKYRDPNLAKLINLCYTYRMESKIDENALDRNGAMFINRINFDQRDFSQRGKDQVKIYKSKEKYRFNDIRIDLNNIAFFDCVSKKSPIYRIQIALRDNYGVVYDTIYKSMCDNKFEFTQTYESLIYPNQEDSQMHESFFVRIPTKSLETLKKLYLIFLVQTLVTNKDSKGNKIKTKFKTDIFGVLPLYDGLKDCILKNDSYILTMWQMDEILFREFVKFDHCKNFKLTDDKMRVTVKIISNEFTHNRFINNLMLLQESNSNSSDYVRIINELKVTSSDELVLYHDKILDKLFLIMNFSKSPNIQDLVFETIIQIIQLFQNEYKDYKDFLDQYIEKHFAHSKVYIPLLHQIRQTSEIIKQGLHNDNQIQNEDVILATMKYLNVVLKLIKISFQEEQQCQDSQPHTAEPKYNDRFGDLLDLEECDQQAMKANTLCDKSPFYQKSMGNYDKYTKIKDSIIHEDDEDDESDNDEDGNGGAIQYLDPASNKTYNASAAAKISMMRKKAIRNTIQQEGLLKKFELSKREFGTFMQKCIISIFEGCHKDAMKSTLSLRALLYEVTQVNLFFLKNITEIFDQITEFMDEKFLSQILIFLYEEQSYQFRLGLKNPANKRGDSNRSVSPFSNQRSSTYQENSNSRTISQQSNMITAPQIINSKKTQNRGSELIEDYVTNKNFIVGLKDLSFINEEYISKLKIVAMGKILANGLFDKVPGNSNKLIKAFCQNIEAHHMKREEMSLHVFYFLHQLFVYLKHGDDYQESSYVSKHASQKLRIFSKSNLDLKDFFTKILPDLLTYLRGFYKQSNINYKLKESKDLEETLYPFREKSALVLLSVANSISKEHIKQFIFNEPKKLANLMVNLKKLVKKISFQDPYGVYFEKKKNQVFRKINEYVISIFMDVDPETLTPEYHQVINKCRMIQIFLWCKLAQIKQDYKKTIRSKTLVKDQLKVHKSKMLEIFKAFWNKYKNVGQPWLGLRYLNKVMQNFLKLGQMRTIKVYMGMISDIIQIEYTNTQDIFHSSNSLFQVFNDLNLEESREEFCKQFYKCFEQEITNTVLYANDNQFLKIVDQRLDQMQKLSEALQNVTYSNHTLNNNQFYKVFCQAKLMEVFWELKLFRLFNQNKEQFKRLHEKLNNFSEMAFTDLRFLQIIQQSEEDYLQIGERKIKTYIEIDLMKSIKENLKKAELYVKSIDVLNQMKDLFENVIYDFDAVSRILKEQAQIYKEMSINPNRHYACYFKIGFFGQSFPSMLKNQEFIYRGGKLVKRIEIIDKIRDHFTDAIIINDGQYPKDSVINGAQKYLQITPVIPLTYRELKDFSLDQKSKDYDELALAQKCKDLPEILRNYYTQNFKNRFYKETVIPSKQGDELQSDIQIEIFKVRDKFPTIINMQSIIKTKKITLNAIDKAVRFVQEHIDKIDTLRKNAQNQSNQEEAELELMSSHIRATLESPIQGGIQRYINAFVTEQYLHSPTDRPKVLLLFKKMEDCSKVLNDAIQLYAQKSNNDFIQTKMSGDYGKFKEQMADIRAYIDGTEVKQSVVQQ